MSSETGRTVPRMPAVIERTAAAEVGDVISIPMSRAQAILLERAAHVIEDHPVQSARTRGLARELRAQAALWRAYKLAADDGSAEALAAAAARWRELAGID